MGNDGNKQGITNVKVSKTQPWPALADKQEIKPINITGYVFFQ